MSVLSRALFDKYVPSVRPALLQYCRSRCGARDAEDLVQDALCRAWSMVGRFHNPDDPEAQPQVLFARWLQSIQAHVCDEWVRRNAGRPEVLLPLDVLQALAEQGSVVQLDQGIEELMWDKVRRMLTRCRLTARQRTCLMRWLSGETQPQIARSVGTSHQAVSAHIKAAITRLVREEVRDVDIEVWEVFREVCRATVYHRPQRTGAGLAVERLRRLR